MKLLKTLKYSLIATLAISVLSLVALFGLYLYISPQLPSIEGLSDTRLQVPLRIYSSDGALLGEFGEKRRTPKKLDEIPEMMQQAFLAAEDNRFYEHGGVDYQGILRAVINLIKTGERGQGGSTITMQLARNFYLSKEKTYTRKINEIFLAFKIEGELSKQQILELYLNKIYLGRRAYGVAAASQIYYGRELEELSIAQIAMIAGLPKAPSTYNPIVNPERALTRRNYVLSRMHALEFITDEIYEQEKQAGITAERRLSLIEVQAPYVNEMVRAEIVKQFGDEAYSRGLNVYTTIKDRLQQAANESLWDGLVSYDRRHGYRGVVRHVDLNEEDPEKSLLNDSEALGKILEHDNDYGALKPALVLSVHDELDTAIVDDKVNPGRHAEIMLKNGDRAILPWEGIEWARPYVTLNNIGKELKRIDEVLRVGDVIWVSREEEGSWSLAQAPDVQGALVAITPNDGAIQALKGGLNFRRSKFNRASQARRQAGSGFKPVIYSSALSKSFTPASLINDAPVVFEDEALEASWRPENYSGKFFGPTRLRKALYKSRNLVSIRLLRSVGVGYAAQFARRFGFDDKALPRDLSLALGSCEVSPLQMARAYAVLANGGYLVQPYLIDRIEDADGTVLFEADPAVACVACELAKRNAEQVTLGLPEDEEEMLPGLMIGSGEESLVDDEGDEEEVLAALPKQAERTLEPRLAYQMNSILQDVVLRGTGRKALSLGRKDLAGKTGTTNDQKDAWFNGYHPDLVATAWVGFDQLKPLGARETGSKAALPIWINFMKQALAGVPEKRLPRPEGLVTMKINAETGAAATDLDKDTIFEIFRSEYAPKAGALPSPGVNTDVKTGAPIPEQLF
ncbi:MAG: penicillin-binding protein 1A [Gammaproteobacteria bacterium]|nr:penicillin-binding protein 1A [Gammaproteobacteria bacterium]MCW8922059.1 penicillin-binding protein 1A [Gammaproteobacteria bacterium]